MLFGKKHTETITALTARIGELEKSLQDARVESNRFKVNGAKSYAAAQNNNLLNGWLTLAKSINYDIRQGGTALRARARQICNDDPYAKKALNTFKKGVVGPKGFTLRNKAGEYKTVNGKREYVLDTLANNLIHEAWWLWGKKRTATIIGNTSFREFCGVIIKDMIRDGEVFIKHVTGKDVNKYGYTLQYVDADLIDERLNKVLPNGNTIIMGVEVDPYFKPVRYWVRKSTPRTEVETGFNYTNDYVPVDAKDMIHLFIKETPHQVRGVSHFAPVAIRLKMLYGWEEAALTRSRATASVPWVQQQRADGAAQPFMSATEKDSENNDIETIEAGELYRVPAGWELKSMDTSYPHPQHEMFVKNIIRSIASGLDVDSITLSSNYEGVTYTSSRSSLLDARDTFKDFHNWIGEHFLDDVFEMWLTMSMGFGAINLPAAKFEKFNQPEWIGRKWAWVDPQNEVNAIKEQLANGLITFEEVLGEQGYDYDEMIPRIAFEIKDFEQQGLIHPMRALLKAAPAPAPETKPANNNGNGKTILQNING